MDNLDPYAQKQASFQRELHALLQNQKSNYSEYLKIMDLVFQAAAQRDDAKLAVYREKERFLIDRIASTDQAYRGLIGQATLPAAARPELERDAAEIENLRREAIAMNKKAEAALGDQCRKIQRELAEIRFTLQKMQGGRMRTGGDPLYIDIET